MASLQVPRSVLFTPRVESLRGCCVASPGGRDLCSGSRPVTLLLLCHRQKRIVVFSGKSSFKRQPLSKAELPALTRSPAWRALFCQAIPGTGVTPGRCHGRLHSSLVSQRSSLRSQEGLSENTCGHKSPASVIRRNGGGGFASRKISKMGETRNGLKE